MSVVWNKIDGPLASIYWDYLRVQERGADSVGYVDPVVAQRGEVGVLLQYAGDLAEIAAQGCTILRDTNDGTATIAVDLANLERLAEHPNVLKLTYGQQARLALDKSLPDIGVIPWFWTQSGGVFKGSVGKGVLIGIIDTGIDFAHPFFLDNTAGLKTRILRIWDQSLRPIKGERGPSIADLTRYTYGKADLATYTYGVEYTNEMIDADRGKPESAWVVRHRDYDGHGTHVASIAAGNGGDAHTFIGVAPGAQLIVVKYLDIEEAPKYIDKEGTEREVRPNQRFMDAVSYILNVAKHAGLPVVINCSAGEARGPHDGFTLVEEWLRVTFENAQGQAFCCAAGNYAGRYSHATITFPLGGGTVDVPFELYDYREAMDATFRHGKWGKFVESLWLEFYYVGGIPKDWTLAASLRPPGAGSSAFINGPELLGALPVEYPPGGIGAPGGGSSHMFHFNDDGLVANKASVKRATFQIRVDHGKDKTFAVGRYTVRLKSPIERTVYVWCTYVPRSAPDLNGYGFRVDATAPPPANVSPPAPDRHQINGYGGADNVITVASYNAEVTPRAMAVGSSRGPLVAYNNSEVALLGITQPPKPDIAAPGEGIDAARSRHVAVATKASSPGLTKGMSGTSAATPHVTGVVALLLEKHPKLTPKQIILILRESATKATKAGEHWPADAAGAGPLQALEALQALKALEALDAAKEAVKALDAPKKTP